VAAEGPGRRELAQAVADHVLGHVDLQEGAAVVHVERVPDELGQDHAGRDHVWIGSLVPFWFIAATFFMSFGWTNGPLLILRLIAKLLAGCRC
jgi:hypothetical protein